MKHVATLTPLLLCALLLAAPTKAQTEISIAPYAGYNTAAGYDVDLDQFYDEGGYGDPEDVGDDVTSAQGGFLLGVGAEIPLPYGGDSYTLKLRPSIETTFVPDNEYHEQNGDAELTTTVSQSYFQLSGDVLAEFIEAGPPSITPYAGAGLSYIRHSGKATQDFNFEDDDNGSQSTTGTAFGLNILGGVGFPNMVQFGVPFVQLRATIGDPTSDRLSDLNVSDMGTAITLTAGLSFGL